MVAPNVIFPAPAQEQEIDKLVRSQYEIWRVEYLARQPKFRSENVRFEHDPEWRNRFLSIQSAHDGNHVVWKVARFTWCMASGFFTAAPLMPLGIIPGLVFGSAISLGTYAYMLKNRSSERQKEKVG